MIKVLLAEDQGMMRGALALLLDLEEDMEVVAQVAAGDRSSPPPWTPVPTSLCWTSNSPAAAAWTPRPSCASSCRPARC